MAPNKSFNSKTKIALFQKASVRKRIYLAEWWFSIIDVIEVLTGTDRPRKYWSDLKSKIYKEGYTEVSEKIGQLKMTASDGKQRVTDCANTETIFRLIQSIPSPKAEPFKKWLAKVGYERIQEIEDPELATKRTRMLYKLKGYPEDWIEKRMRGISIREELTEEWQRRGAERKQDFEILTADISRATFNMTPSQYKKLKGLTRENLRDHMNDFELIFTMLGERSTTEIHRNEDSKGVKKLREDAKSGGQIAGNARHELERKLKRPVISNTNFKKLK
ncbi:Bro-N domain-containing protein [Candidatus Woesebacteria bacterium]|nr:Bro-N domain-containing protein [Candidatus Woesebacteria bacterium]